MTAGVFETIRADADLIAPIVPGVDEFSPFLAPFADSDVHLHSAASGV